MKLLKNFFYKEGNKTFSCKKVTFTSESGEEKKKYSVCYSDGVNIPEGYYLPTRAEAREKLLSLLRSHTFLTKSQMLKL